MVSKSLLEFGSKNYDFNINTLEYIPRSSGKIMNKIYTFNKNDKKYIIKFAPCSMYNNQLKETKAEMDYIYYLSENNMSVSVPLKTINGELVISTQDNGEEYIITAFAWLNGQSWGYDGSNDKMSFNWGKTMGDIHRVTKNYKPENEYDVKKDILNSYYWDSFFDDLKIYPTAYKITQDLLGEIAVLPRDKDSFGIIHGDMHQGNFFVDGDEINVFDYGDSIYGWFSLDIAISLCHALWWGRKDAAGNDSTNTIIGNFINGYLSANCLSDFWISKIPMFMKYRHLCMDPEKNGIGCNREEWIHNIENDILFDGCKLKLISDIIEKVKLIKLISDNYDVEVKDLKLIDSYFGTKIFALQTNKGKYIVKTLLPYTQNMENEGHITEYLYDNGISVARLLKTNRGMYHAETEEMQFHVQEFIEGETLKVNTAPDWFLRKSAIILGEIHNVLKNYDELPTQFGGDFFGKSNVSGIKHHYAERLEEAINQENTLLIPLLEERIKHLERISSFDIDADRLTYSNSHGDFYIGQIIVNDENITVIDWTSACKLPVCLEVIMSYVFADPKCRNGEIDNDGLKEYINHYSQYFSLNDYDIQIMPYLYYYHQMICNYSPPYDDIPETYKPICNLIINVTNWLYKNVDDLSKKLRGI
ncbi:MAG: phosphotransferase [Oscillospiraceae bacterium]|nr:phosphotransferase [Oscillospiraceae bacterium]